MAAFHLIDIIGYYTLCIELYQIMYKVALLISYTILCYSCNSYKIVSKDESNISKITQSNGYIKVLHSGNDVKVMKNPTMFSTNTIVTTKLTPFEEKAYDLYAQVTSEKRHKYEAGEKN